MNHPLQVISIILVIRAENKFLLVKRSKTDDIFPGYWQNMGGKVEVGETVEQAIYREMVEEVGLKSSSTPIFLHSYSWTKDFHSPTKLGLIFLIKMPQQIKELKIKLCEELDDFGWYSLDEAKKLKTIGLNSPTGTIGQLLKSLQYLEP